jgi:hypothetical protein
MDLLYDDIEVNLNEIFETGLQFEKKIIIEIILILKFEK